ncbi:MAG: glycosyltransferase [Prevotella sp.]|nr:glycosyltransferase [Prevotella sp.]
MNYSIIVPVYNRPDEVDELLQSLTTQTEKDFEVIIVEDGSAQKCEDVCKRYADILDLHYYYKENSGPGQSRNYGAERARGDYLIILDSDVVLPESYLSNVRKNLKAQGAVAFGGPDRSHPSFTSIQKAISYSMTSFFTTGGIRGGSSPLFGRKRGGALDKFYPRSFNMGIRRDVYQELGGFSKMRFGEDIDFSYRIVEAGYEPKLFPETWVWHKRRTDLRKFWRQVFNSGIARINLSKRHPGTLKLVHLLPAVFTVSVVGLLLLALLGLAVFLFTSSDPYSAGHMQGAVGFALFELSLLPIILYALLIFIDSSTRNRNILVGLLSVPAAFVQLMGYGCGFIQAWWRRIVRGQDEFTAYEKNFYK